MRATSTRPDPAAMTPEDRAAYDRKRGRFVPWIIVAFFVSFVALLTNFVIFAFEHQSSEVTPHAYDKGLAYNRTLEAAEAQGKLGWKADIAYSGQKLTLNLTDKQGRAIADARAKAFFVNAAEARLDRSADLKALGGGAYAVVAGLPRGNWKIYVTAGRGGDEYQASLIQEIQ